MAKILVVLSAFLAIAYGNYCNMNTCKKGPHTLCIFQSAQPARTCRNIQGVSLKPSEKTKILNLHNKLRKLVASGGEKRGAPGPQPKAANMKIMQWDNELEGIAQRWANQCQFKHDSCRDVSRFQVGQNIAYIGTTGDVNTIDVEEMVNNWYNEVQYYNSNAVDQFRSGKVIRRDGTYKQIGHYTQLVWAETNKLGCGAIKYTEGIYKRFLLVCNYGPAGNFLEMPVYKKST